MYSDLVLLMVHADLSILVQNQVYHVVVSPQLIVSYEWGFNLRVHCLGVSLQLPFLNLYGFHTLTCIPVCLSAEDAPLVSIIYFTCGQLWSCTSKHLISHLTHVQLLREYHIFHSIVYEWYYYLFYAS